MGDNAPLGKYTPLRGSAFRKIAMAFWGPPTDGSIYGHLHCNVLKAIRFRDDCEKQFGIRPSMGHLLGRAIARALTNTPQGNSKIIWGKAYSKDTVDVYFQVDVEDGKDLSGVVVPDTGRKSVIEVATILRERAKRLRDGNDEQYEKTQKGLLSYLPSFLIRWLLGFLTFLEYNLGITPTWLGAKAEPFGTVMLTNVSGFGIDVAYAPLVPVSRVPLCALMGGVTDQPWVVNGELVVRPVMAASATFDHRLMDGNKIGRIVRDVRAYMENPYPFEPGLELEEPEWDEYGVPVDAAKAEDAKARDATAEDATAEGATAEGDATAEEPAAAGEEASTA